MPVYAILSRLKFGTCIFIIYELLVDVRKVTKKKEKDKQT